MAMGALRAIGDMGLRVPEEVALIGFDDPAWAALVSPPLTTVAQPTYELGQVAASLLLRRLAEPDDALQAITLPVQLVLRASCGSHEPAHPSGTANGGAA